MKTFFSVLVVSFFILSTNVPESEGKDLWEKIVRTVTGEEKCAKAEDLKCPRPEITFWLYTKSNQKGTQLQAGSLAKAGWSKGPLKLIVHGYSVSKDTAVNAVLRPAYFKNADFNIISVDWSALGKQGCYYQAKNNVPTVAKCVANFMNAVLAAHKFDGTHLLGHSMGAHIAERASEEIKGLQRLTKFDPAMPLFTDKSTKKGSAGLVDVYHSNMGMKGQKENSGDVNVIFNNGAFQPGCKCDTSCSHLRAVQYFAESIGKTMKGFPCSSWDDFKATKCAVPTAKDLVELGDNCKAKKGVFMVFTRPSAPFLEPDSVYTNRASFIGFQKSDSNQCKITDVLKDL